MICRVCNVVMKSGTSYEQKNGQNTRKRYDECPKCHYRKYDKDFAFHELLLREERKNK